MKIVLPQWTFLPLGMFSSRILSSSKRSRTSQFTGVFSCSFNNSFAVSKIFYRRPRSGLDVFNNILGDNNRFATNTLKSLLYSIDNFKLLRLQFRITELIRFRKDDNGFGLEVLIRLSELRLRKATIHLVK